MKKEIKFTLNGEERSVYIDTTDTLLDVIRDKMGIKSPKCGCDRGDCGTCTVLLNGQSVRSCLILGVEVDGYEVTTVEGLSKNGPTILEKSFVKHNSFQCGYCAPGVVITTTEFLKKVKNPNDEEIKEAISGHLCRCTGYNKMIDAIGDCAKRSTVKSFMISG